MNFCYLLHPQLKLIPQLDVALLPDQKIDLNAVERAILLKAQARPVFAQELDGIQPLIKSRCLISFPFKIRELSEATPHDVELLPVAKEFSRYMLLEVTGETTIEWNDYSLQLNNGLYFIPLFYPAKIKGPHSKKYFRDQSITEARDQWFLNLIQNAQLPILELGPGRESRLATQIAKLFPHLPYVGVDLEATENKSIVKGDFTDDRPAMPQPHMVIACEVIEHLSEHKTLALISDLLNQGASLIALSTPNSDFNSFLGRDGFRIADHQFEWNEAEVKAWLIEVEKLGCEVLLGALGKNISEMRPTWTIIIKKK
jgi:hypothetical protein